jgi:hypothetical protein
MPSDHFLHRRSPMRELIVALLLIGVFSSSIQFVRGAETPAISDRPGAYDGPTQVSIGIWVVDISKFDSAEQSFTADGAVVLR